LTLLRLLNLRVEHCVVPAYLSFTSVFAPSIVCGKL